MRRAWILGLVLATVACGGADGPSGNAVLVDLGDADQRSVCDDFVDAICAQPELQDFCTPCVTGTGCRDATMAGAIDSECPAPITAGMVRECGDSGDFGVCQQGGGCMFDALEVVCD